MKQGWWRPFPKLSFSQNVNNLIEGHQKKKRPLNSETAGLRWERIEMERFRSGFAIHIVMFLSRGYGENIVG